MNIAQHRINNERAKSGTWIKFDEDGEFLIASTNSREFRNFTAVEVRKAGVKIKKAGAYEEITTRALAECCILDWKGLDDNKKPFPCTPENKMKLLKDCPEIRAWVAEQAGEIANFQAEALAEDAADLKSVTALESEEREG